MAEQQEYNPLLQAFDGDEKMQNHLRFHRWLEENKPLEEHQPDQEGVDFMQMVIRREKLKLLMHH